MVQFQSLTGQISDEKDQEGLDRQRNGDQYDVQGVIENDVALE